MVTLCLWQFELAAPRRPIAIAAGICPATEGLARVLPARTELVWITGDAYIASRVEPGQEVSI